MRRRSASVCVLVCGRRVRARNWKKWEQKWMAPTWRSRRRAKERRGDSRQLKTNKRRLWKSVGSCVAHVNIGYFGQVQCGAAPFCSEFEMGNKPANKPTTMMMMTRGDAEIHNDLEKRRRTRNHFCWCVKRRWPTMVLTQMQRLKSEWSADGWPRWCAERRWCQCRFHKLTDSKVDQCWKDTASNETW